MDIPCHKKNNSYGQCHRIPGEINSIAAKPISVKLTQLLKLKNTKGSHFSIFDYVTVQQNPFLSIN